MYAFSIEFEVLAQKAPVSIMFLDKAGTVRFVNDWHLTHFARGLHDRAFFLNRSLFELPGIVSAGVGSLLRPVLEGRDVLLERVFTAEFSGGHQGYQTIRCAPVYLAGAVNGAVVIREDVSAWVSMECSCRDEQLRLRDLLNATSDSAILVDQHGRFVAANDEAGRRRGTTAEALIGKSLYRHLDKDVAQYRRAMSEKVLAGGKPVEFEEKSNATTYRVSIFPVVNAAGEVTHLASFSRDITERKLMEHALIQARERAEASLLAKTQFLANISHELRTPLNGILGAAQLAQDAPQDEEMRELWAIVAESGERLLQNINALIDLADISSHALQASMKPFRLRPALESVVRSFGVQARLKGLELAVEVDDHIPDQLVGDEFRLRQILTSLISNAVRCTHAGGVLVSVSPLRDAHPDADAMTCVGGLSLAFTVQDTGVGIPQDRLGSIFDSFSLAEDLLTKRHSGTGVGLSIARSLVELLGGRIWAESEPGGGSTFHFSASFWTPQPDAFPGLPDPARQDGDGPRLTILLVEDERINRVTALRMLRNMGHTVEEAENGQEALHKLNSAAFDLVLMDIQMPVMDGLTATKLIRNGELPGVDRDIPVIALTAYATRQDTVRFLRQGLSGFVPKPFNIHDLRQAIAQVSSARPGR